MSTLTDQSVGNSSQSNSNSLSKPKCSASPSHTPIGAESPDRTNSASDARQMMHQQPSHTISQPHPYLVSTHNPHCAPRYQFAHPPHFASANGLSKSPPRSSHPPLLQLQQFMLGQWHLFQNQLDPPTTSPPPTGLTMSVTHAVRKPNPATPPSPSNRAHPGCSYFDDAQFRRHSEATTVDRHVGPNYRRRGSSLVGRQMLHHSNFDGGHSWQRGQLISSWDIGSPSKVSRRAKLGSSIGQRGVVVNVHSRRGFGGMIDVLPSDTSFRKSAETPSSSTESSPTHTPSDQLISFKAADGTNPAKPKETKQKSTDDSHVIREEIQDQVRLSLNISPSVNHHDEEQSECQIVSYSETPAPPLQFPNALQSPMKQSTQTLTADARSPSSINYLVDVQPNQMSNSLAHKDLISKQSSRAHQLITVRLPASPERSTQKNSERADTPTTSELYWTPDPPSSPSSGMLVGTQSDGNSNNNNNNTLCKPHAPHPSTSSIVSGN